MSSFADHYSKSKSKPLMSENGLDLVVKCSIPRLMGAKYFPLLKAKRFNIQMNDDGSTANLRISTVNDLINIMKEVDRDIQFNKSGDVITILDNTSKTNSEPIHSKLTQSSEPTMQKMVP